MSILTQFYLIHAKFQNDVNEIGVLEYAIKLNDELLVQGFVDFYFG